MSVQPVLTVEEVRALAGGAADLEGITFLSIVNKGVQDIKVMDKLVNLISLDLSKNEISSIDALKDCANLRYLKLTHNTLDSGALRELIGFSALSNIRALDLGHNQISGDEARDILLKMLLPNMQELRSLNIEGCPFAMDPSNQKHLDTDFMNDIVDTATGLTALNGIRVRTLSGFVMDSIADPETVKADEGVWKDNTEKLMQEVQESLPDVEKWFEEDGINSLIQRLPGLEEGAEDTSSVIPEADELLKKINETTKAIQQFIENNKQQPAE